MAGGLIDLMGESLMRSRVPTTQAQGAEYLAARLGGGRAAARALGVAESTFRGWRGGVVSRKGIGARLATLARTMAPGLAHARGDGSLTITGIITVSSDTRERTIHPGRNIPGPIIRQALTRWVNGNDNTAEAIIYGAIDRYYQPLEFDQIIRVWFE